MSLKFSLPTVPSLPFWQMARWSFGAIWRAVAKSLEAGAANGWISVGKDQYCYLNTNEMVIRFSDIKF